MSNEEMVADIQSGADRMAELYEGNRGLIYSIANKYSGRAELDDLAQEGYLGLRAAATRYDAARGVPFANYAAYWIESHIRLYVQGTSPVRLPRHRYEQVARYRKICGELEAVGQDGSTYRIASLMGVSMEVVGEIARASDMHTVSLHAPVADGVELADTIPDTTDDMEQVEDRLQQEELKRVLDPMIDNLPKRQAEVIRGRYFEGLHLSEIGKDAHSVHAQALRSLRKLGNLRRLRPFINIYSDAVKGGGVRNFDRTWTSSTERVAMDLYDG